MKGKTKLLCGHVMVILQPGGILDFLIANIGEELKLYCFPDSGDGAAADVWSSGGSGNHIKCSWG